MHRSQFLARLLLPVLSLACGADESGAQSPSANSDEPPADETNEVNAGESPDVEPDPTMAENGEPPEEPTADGYAEPWTLMQGRWRVTYIGATEIPENAGLVLDMEEGRVRVSTPCGEITATGLAGSHDFRFVEVRSEDESCEASVLEQKRSLMDAMRRTAATILDPRAIIFQSAPAPGEIPGTAFAVRAID